MIFLQGHYNNFINLKYNKILSKRFFSGNFYLKLIDLSNTFIFVASGMLLLLLLSCVTLWLVPRQAPLSMELSRQEYWSGLPCPPPGGSSQPRDQTQVSCIAGRSFTTEPPGKPSAPSILSLFIAMESSF